MSEQEIDQAWSDYWDNLNPSTKQSLYAVQLLIKIGFKAGYESHFAKSNVDNSDCVEHDLYDDGDFYRCYNCDYKESVK